MTRSTKTRLLLRDKCKVVHSDRLYRPVTHELLMYYVLCTLYVGSPLCTVLIFDVQLQYQVSRTAFPIHRISYTKKNNENHVNYLRYQTPSH